MTVSIESNAQQVLESLDRWDNKMRGHCQQKRRHSRSKFREVITIYIPSCEETVGESPEMSVISGWARNISQSGLGFIFHKPIKDSEIILCLKNAKGKTVYMRAKVVRNRQVHQGFWEYGVEFLSRESM